MKNIIIHARRVFQCNFYLAFSLLAFITVPLHSIHTTSSSFAYGEEATSPKKDISSTIDAIVKAIEKFPGDAQAQPRRAAIRDILNPRFDFDKMAQLSLGTNWKDISDAQKSDFKTVFANLLSKTYLSKVETIKKDMVSVDAESIDPTTKRATVKTIVRSQGSTFPIDYKLTSESGSWKVYDIVIENIGLIVNYRNEFSSIIRKDTFDGLLKQLKEKTTS